MTETETETGGSNGIDAYVSVIEDPDDSTNKILKLGFDGVMNTGQPNEGISRFT